ncbi:MAG: hypothetical protein NTX55_02710 [Candidatus Parcubacteria bacterium]|nr:hypothetical protein [Candidatus Parcubacteria bacterium]
MNFLPEEDKRKIKKEYLRRLFAVIGIFFFFAVFIGIILLLSFSVFLKDQEHNLERQMAVSGERLARNNIGDTISLIEELNAKISLLDPEQKNIGEKSALTKIILEEKTNKIKINNFSFIEGKILIQGVSDNRQGLLSFIDSLKKKKEFKGVESPVSNLIKEKDIDFRLTIEL